jgi:hypothetical protein
VCKAASRIDVGALYIEPLNKPLPHEPIGRACLMLR